ncbi:hypothetical protein SAMN05444273_1166 [Litoreibacter ascidiaceicola]|uniref:Uncharacterized protein n=1 Tax=Litoreibacter ascidiaceicola TaxID=1486859 RepID=A0A1M5EXB9_9RHOB|nr:hypothetical protein SAMN05444273_1166 [Litoreibacter ascidiaceicola]
MSYSIDCFYFRCMKFLGFEVLGGKCEFAAGAKMQAEYPKRTLAAKAVLYISDAKSERLWLIFIGGTHYQDIPYHLRDELLNREVFYRLREA